MAISINGNGTITGISVGGLPDGCVDNGTLANSSVNSNQIVNGAVGAAEIADIFSNGGITIGGLRIMTGSFTTPSSVSDVGNNTSYPGARYYIVPTISVSGFATVPSIIATLASGYHEAYQATAHESSSSTAIKPFFSGHRSGGLQNQPIYWAAIGEAS
tara:strand:- start:186 stop:662 length:477 start_codon:yes stop_codon:yes gene_type:complete